MKDEERILKLYNEQMLIKREGSSVQRGDDNTWYIYTDEWLIMNHDIEKLQVYFDIISIAISFRHYLVLHVRDKHVAEVVTDKNNDNEEVN